MNFNRLLGKGRNKLKTSDGDTAAPVSRRDLLKSGGVLGGAAVLSGAAALMPRALAQADNTTLTLDVACDGRTWRFDTAFADTFAGDLMTIKRGTMFIVNGKIYPAGTIDAGLSGPDQEGAIGTWVCRGGFYFDFADIGEGAVPHAATTQYYLFDDGSALYSEGLEGGVQVVRLVTGGVGTHFGARGEVTQEEVGENDTELAGWGVPAPNIVFGFATV